MSRQREREQQSAVVQWARSSRYPLSLLFHVPNGGSRNVIEAANLKRAGVLAGIPDLFLPVSRGGFHGIFVEMKSAKGRESDLQTEMIKDLREQGYHVLTAYSAREAIEEIAKYVKLPVDRK